MSKKVIIFHGTGAKPTSFWYPWLAKQLESKGYVVEIPYYPDINRVDIASFLPKVLHEHSFDQNTILIGHSAGAPLLLSILENIDVVLQQAILVAGYAQELPEDKPQAKDPFIQDSYNWDKIRQQCKDFVFINSVNDPWGCNDQEGRYLFDKLGGTLVIQNEGHSGSGTHNQPYPEFPLLEKLVA